MDERSQPGDDPGPPDRGPKPPAFDMSQIDIEGLLRALQSPGPVNWEVASQVATMLAGEGDRGADDQERSQLEELAHAALTHVVGETGLAAAHEAPVRVVGRVEWARIHIDALRPVLEALAGALENAIAQGEGGEASGPAGPAQIPGPFGLPLGPDTAANAQALERGA